MPSDCIGTDFVNLLQAIECEMGPIKSDARVLGESKHYDVNRKKAHGTSSACVIQSNRASSTDFHLCSYENFLNHPSAVSVSKVSVSKLY